MVFVDKSLLPPRRGKWEKVLGFHSLSGTLLVWLPLFLPISSAPHHAATGACPGLGVGGLCWTLKIDVAALAGREKRPFKRASWMGIRGGGLYALLGGRVPSRAAGTSTPHMALETGARPEPPLQLDRNQRATSVAIVWESNAHSGKEG